MKPKILNGIKASALLTLFVVSLIVGMMYLSQIQDPIIKQTSVKRVATLVTGDPAAGQSGFFYIQIRAHSGNPGVDYASNLTTATAWEYSTTGNNGACTGETHYAAAFDIVVKVGVNNSDGYNATSSAWDNSYVWVNITCADLTIGANTDMTEVQIAAAGTTYRWMQYYMNNGGVGYTIDVGEHFNVTSVKQGVMRPVP